VIPHFPDPYPGEAFFSVYARFCERLGSNANSRTSRLFFGRSYKVSVLLPYGLDHVIENLPLGHSYTADQLIDENTVLPFFAPFLESTRYENAKLDMRGKLKEPFNERVTNVSSKKQRWTAQMLIPAI
jgi:hypothetical protein